MSRLRSWTRYRWASLVAIGATALVAYVVASATVLPINIVSLDTEGASSDARLNAIADTRSALLGLLAPLAVVVGGIAALLSYRATAEQNRAVLEETRRQNLAIQEQDRSLLELQRRGQVTERFTKAIEQLGQRGAEKLDVRIGAVYALEQIARDSDELHWPVMEVLTAYLREHAPATAAVDGRLQPLAADHQAIVTVLGRRNAQREDPRQRLDLHETQLTGAYLGTANLAGANLEGAILCDADLAEANLSAANLESANLREASLYQANLSGANLRNTNWEHASLEDAILTRVDLSKANMNRACLWFADLSEARIAHATLGRAALGSANLTGATLDATNLGKADLRDACLAGAHLSFSYFGGANLEGADLRSADLLGTYLTRTNLTGADLRGANLHSVVDLTLEQLLLAASIEGARLPSELAEQLAQRPEAAATEPAPEATAELSAPSGGERPASTSTETPPRRPGPAPKRTPRRPPSG